MGQSEPKSNQLDLLEVDRLCLDAEELWKEEDLPGEPVISIRVSGKVMMRDTVFLGPKVYAKCVEYVESPIDHSILHLTVAKARLLMTQNGIKPSPSR